MQVFLRGNPTINAIVASIVAASLFLASFALFEPMVAHGVDSNAFEVTAQISSEISFLTQPGDVDMTGSPIDGVTGGQVYGTSTFNVTTNDPDGYTVSIAFATGTAMQGEGLLTTDIDNYTPAVALTTDNDWSVAVGDAEFAYSIHGVTDAVSVDDVFNDDGAGSCGTGTVTTLGKCWYGRVDATSSVQIINAAGATASTGATTSVVFLVAQNGNAGLEAGNYTATATLTANVK